MYMLAAQYQFVMKLCLIKLLEISIQKWGEGQNGGQLRPESYSYTVAPLHRTSNFQQNKREARLSCYLALFSEKGHFL